MRLTCLLAALLLAMTTGCGDGKPKEFEIESKAKTDALGQAKDLLKRYADGQPMASEVMNFPKMVNDVKAIDPAKAEVLEKGLDNLQKSKGNLKSAAKDLLNKL